MHPATVANVEILRQRGANFIGPEKGMLVLMRGKVARPVQRRQASRQVDKVARE